MGPIAHPVYVSLRASFLRLSILWLAMAAQSAATAQSTNDCPSVATLPNKTGWELGAANYAGRQEGETITVTATGENSTAGFKVQLAREPEKIFPPKLALYRKPPNGIAAQVITPFTVCVTFNSRQRVPAVTVRDSRGEHRVLVESVR